MDRSKTATCDVTVNAIGVALNKKSMILAEGDTESLTVTIKPATAENRDVTWSSSASNVASVDGSGKVLAISNFLYSAYSILKDESLKQAAYAKLETAIEVIGKEAPVPKSYYSGIAGLGWAVHFLHKHHWLQEDVDGLLFDFDQLLSSAVDEYLVYRNLGFIAWRLRKRTVQFFKEATR